MALSLLSLIIYCLITPKMIKPLNRFILIIMPLAIITGTLLVYLKHYTFHIAWIKAAYLFSFLIMVIIGCMIIFKEKLKKRLFWKTTYLIVLIMLVLIAHDAVRKMTFFVF